MSLPYNYKDARFFLNRSTRLFLTAALLLAMILASFGAAYSADVILAWNPNTEPELAGYKLYYGNATRAYSSGVNADIADLNNPSTTFSGIEEGKTYYFAVTAYDSYGNESDYSNEVVCATVTSSAGTNGSISPSGVVVVEYGTSKTFTFNPDPGYHVADVTVDGQSQGPADSHTFSGIASSHSIQVRFEADQASTYSIVAAAQSQGSISPSGTTPVIGGGAQTYSISASLGYQISDVLVDGVSVGAVDAYTFSNVVANHTITAVFAPLNYTITATTGANGGISPSGTISVNYGSGQSYTITAADNYQIADVVVDGKSVGAVSNYVFSNVTANHTISAAFSKITHTVSASPGVNGAISPSGSVRVEHGSDQAFTFTADPGYKVGDVLVDGVSAGAVSNYTFSSVVADHYISVSFKPQNEKPVADAGPDRTVNEQEVVTLNGANSSDPDDGIKSYSWTQTGGTGVTLSDPSAASPTFTAPNVGPSGEALTFSLTVTDNGGLQATDTCIVNVTWVNDPPVADAGPTLTVEEGANVTLDGSKSSDPDDGIASYQWTQIAGTSVSLEMADAASPTFIAPQPSSGVESEALSFELTVRDHGGLKSNAKGIVNVTLVNHPPVANAGGDQTVYAGDTVMLDGSLSSDPEGGTISYRWSLLSALPVVLSDPTAVAPTFIAPVVTQDETPIDFLLTVTDSAGLVKTDVCAVHVNKRLATDLTASWLKFSYERGKISGAIIIQNTGTQNAGPFTTSVYLSNGGVTSPTLLKEYATSSLNAGKSVSLTFNYSSKVNLSGQRIIVKTDSKDAIAEPDESNNLVERIIP